MQQLVDKITIRDKAIEVDEKELYDIAYDYDSSFAHGLWGAILSLYWMNGKRLRWICRRLMTSVPSLLLLFLPEHLSTLKICQLHS